MARTVIPEEAWVSARALVDGTVIKVDQRGTLPRLTNGLVTLTMHVGIEKRGGNNQRRLVTGELALETDEGESTFKGAVIELRNGEEHPYSGRLAYSGRFSIRVAPGRYTRRLRLPSGT